MSSTKCRACGLTNFSSAIVCRRCQYPLFGQGAPPAYQRKPSQRWIVNAVLVSIILAVVLLFAVYFLSLIFTFQDPEQLRDGWVNFTPEQYRTMGFRYGLVLLPSLILVWRFFYRRRDQYGQ